MLRMIGPERRWTGNLSTRWFHWLLRGKTGQRPTWGPRLPSAAPAVAASAASAAAVRTARLARSAMLRSYARDRRLRHRLSHRAGSSNVPASPLALGERDRGRGE